MTWDATYVRKALSDPLPGRAAHDLLMPFRRPAPEQAISDGKNPKIGAVMMLLYPEDDSLQTVLMLRPEYDGVHSAQISFPGGKQERDDLDLAWTARRETREEIAVPEHSIEVVRALTTLYIPPSNFIVHPFVGFLEEKPTFIPDAREVAAVIETPINTFLSADSLIEKKIPVSGSGMRISVKGFPVGEHFVWGATAMVLMEFREALLRHR